MHVQKAVRLAALVIVAALFTAAPLSCSPGPAKGEVRGKVTFKGKPVTEGTVTLLNLTEGGNAEAQIGKDGTFAVPGTVAVGEYVVEIKPLVVIVDTDPGKSPPAPEEKPAPDIPRKYRMQGTTPLRAPVKAGKNEFNFEMMP